MALLLGAAGPSTEPTSAGAAPVFGVHPPQAYPPLSAPPGPPQLTGDDSVDRRFEKRLHWLLLLVLLLGFLLTTANLFIGPLAWGEMPGDHALLQVQRGSASAVVDGRTAALGVEDAVYVSRDDTIAVDPRSRAVLTYRGGASSILCAGTAVTVGSLSSAGHPIEPTAALRLDRGLLLTDSFTRSAAAFAPLGARITGAAGDAVNDGPAWFAVAPWGVIVSEGAVTLDGRVQTPTHAPLGCGDGGGAVIRPSVTPTPAPTTAPSPTTTPSALPTATPTTTTTTAPPPTTTHPAPSTPVSDSPPAITGVSFIDPTNFKPIQQLVQSGCPGVSSALVIATVSDDHGIGAVSFSWRLKALHPVSGGPVSMQLHEIDDAGGLVIRQYVGVLPVFTFDQSNAGTLSVTVSAVDSANQAAPVAGASISVTSCLR